jgi:hypothetical protein
MPLIGMIRLTAMLTVIMPRITAKPLTFFNPVPESH